MSDLISVSSLLKNSAQIEFQHSDGTTATYIAVKAIELEQRFNSVDAEPVRHAHWEYWAGWMSNHDMRLEYECSCCGHKGCIRGHGIKNIQFLPEYCPSCKSKMDEVGE